MSVSLKEVIEAAGYDLSSYDDCKWLLSTVTEFEDLVVEAEDTIERIEDERDSV